MGLCLARARIGGPWEWREIVCRRPEGHGPDGNPEHAGVGLYPWQTIYWLDDDRRTFRGDFVPCHQLACILPAGHRGDHAR